MTECYVCLVTHFNSICRSIIYVDQPFACRTALWIAFNLFSYMFYQLPVLPFRWQLNMSFDVFRILFNLFFTDLRKKFKTNRDEYIHGTSPLYINTHQDKPLPLFGTDLLYVQLYRLNHIIMSTWYRFKIKPIPTKKYQYLKYNLEWVFWTTKTSTNR